MNLHKRLAIALLVAAYCPAQEGQEHTEIEALKQIMLQSSPETKLSLLDQYRNDFQQAGLISWAYDQICRSFEAAGQPERALAAGEHLVALDPEDVETGQKGLKIAERKQDAAAIRKWSELAARAAKSVIASPSAGKDRIEFARTV